MSRSRWACAESCAPVNAAARGAGRLATREARVPLGDGRLPSTARSLTRRCWLAATALLVLALTPAVSVARVGASPDSRKSDPPQAGSAPARDAIAGARWLAVGSGYLDPHGSQLVRALQRRLAWAGYAPGPIDGRYGALTEQAVTRFQADHGLSVDGIAGPATLAALSVPIPVLYPGAGYLEAGGSGAVRGLQRRLAAAGFAPGAIDGRDGPLTTEAVVHFQRAHRLQTDGIVGPVTWRALDAASRRRTAPGTPTVRPLLKNIPSPTTIPSRAARPPARVDASAAACRRCRSRSCCSDSRRWDWRPSGSAMHGPALRCIVLA